MTLVETLPAQVSYVGSSDGGVLVGSRLVVWNGLAVTGNNIKTLTVTVVVGSGLSPGANDLAAQGFLDYPGGPPELTECLSERVHTAVVLPVPPVPPPPALLSGPVRAYPNPFAVDRAVRGTVKFQGLRSGGKLHLYELSGLLVWEGVATAEGRLEWNGRNAAGKKVAPGVYLWRADGTGGEERGKLIVE